MQRWISTVCVFFQIRQNIYVSITRFTKNSFKLICKVCFILLESTLRQEFSAENILAEGVFAEFIFAIFPQNLKVIQKENKKVIYQKSSKINLNKKLRKIQKIA